MRTYRCRCGRPVFFRNSQCLGCGALLGYAPERGELLWLAAGDGTGANTWMAGDAAQAAVGGTPYTRCAHLNGPSACNWLIVSDDTVGEPALCRCCRLLRTLPDLSWPENQRWFAAIELARRQLVARLILLGLPVRSRLMEDRERGMAFDLLRAQAGGPPVVTGHAHGVITLDIEEADDATRETRRRALGEPARTLLGHLRHECGHYYWQRLVEGSDALDACRALFGDERQDYAQALARHYAHGPAADWPTRHVTAYASAHPWEDWAETWAHYLHFVDTHETARALGLSGQQVALEFTPFDAQALGDDSADANAFASTLVDWMALAAAINELCRSMGAADFYPFVLSAPAARKLYFVHRVVHGVLHRPGSAHGVCPAQAA